MVLKDRLHEKVRFPPLPSGVGRVRDSGNTCPQQLAKGRIIRTHGGVHGWTDGGPPFTGPTASPFIALFDQGKDHAGHDHCRVHLSHSPPDRKSVVSGKVVSVRVNRG